MKITEKELRLIRDRPHLLGHLVGKDKLTDLHSEWIKWVWSENDHRSLQAHRGSYKTTSVAIMGSIWWMLFHPDQRIGIIRKTFTDASEILKNISNLMKLDEIKSIFLAAHGFVPVAIVDKADKLVFNFKGNSTPEGNINAYGINQSITGAHLDFALFDDFITILDKISSAIRERTKVMLEEVKENVLDPGKGAGYIGTPWHSRDAWGDVPDPVKYDVYSTNILTENQIRIKKERTTNTTWNANYLLRHVSSEKSIFKDPNFQKWDRGVTTGIGHIDAAYGGDCYTALTFIARKKDGRYQGIGKIFEGDIRSKKGVIKSLWERFRIGTIYTEQNADKGFLSEALSSDGIPSDNYHEKMNKHIKIVAHGYENGFWNLIDWDPEETDDEYLNMILDYTEGTKPDDSPDSLASIGRILISSAEDNFSSLYSM